MSKAHSPGARRFLEHLERARYLRRQVVDGDGLAPEQRALSEWQTSRLAATYDDFARRPRFRAALDFFLSDLYGTEDFTQRDADIERVYPIMVRVLSENALESMSLAVELHALTQELDSRLIAALARDGIDLAAQPGALDQAAYARAYRRCDSYADRVRQIDLIVETGGLLDEVVRHRMIYVTVKLARGPAHAAGFGELQDFIERGLRAFRRMKGADDFLAAIRHREMSILDQIYRDAPLADWGAAAFAQPAPSGSN